MNDGSLLHVCVTEENSWQSHTVLFILCAFKVHTQSYLFTDLCLIKCDTVVVAGAWIKAGRGSGPSVGGVRRGLAGASWIILQPKDPPLTPQPHHPLQSPGQWGLNSSCSSTPKKNPGRTTKTLFLPGPSGWELSVEGGKHGWREGGREGVGGGRRE